MNLGTGRIVVIVALVVGGIAVLVNGFSGSTAAAPSGGSTVPTSSSPTPSQSSSPTPVATPSPQVDGVRIAVFNGTTAAGLGAQAQATLTNAGYVAPTDAQNAPTTGIAITTVYYRGGAAAEQNKSNAAYMVKKFFKGGKIALLGNEFDTLIQHDVQLVVVLGEDYAAKAGA